MRYARGLFASLIALTFLALASPGAAAYAFSAPYEDLKLKGK